MGLLPRASSMTLTLCLILEALKSQSTNQASPGSMIAKANTKEHPIVLLPNGLIPRTSTLLSGWEQQELHTSINYGVEFKLPFMKEHTLSKSKTISISGHTMGIKILFLPLQPYLEGRISICLLLMCYFQQYALSFVEYLFIKTKWQMGSLGKRGGNDDVCLIDTLGLLSICIFKWE